jgi:hypothetical protein
MMPKYSGNIKCQRGREADPVDGVDTRDPALANVHSVH